MLIAVVANTREYERRYCTPGAIHGILYARTMSDADLLAAARDENHPAYVAMLTAMGPNTNREWITARCAVTAYERGLMDGREMDRITE